MPSNMILVKDECTFPTGKPGDVIAIGLTIKNNGDESDFVHVKLVDVTDVEQTIGDLMGLAIPPGVQVSQSPFTVDIPPDITKLKLGIKVWGWFSETEPEWTDMNKTHQWFVYKGLPWWVIAGLGASVAVPVVIIAISKRK